MSPSSEPLWLWRLKDYWWKVYNAVVYRSPIHPDEGVTYKLTPRWQRRKPTAKQVHQYEADLLDRQEGTGC